MTVDDGFLFCVFARFDGLLLRTGGMGQSFLGLMFICVTAFLLVTLATAPDNLLPGLGEQCADIFAVRIAGAQIAAATFIAVLTNLPYLSRFGNSIKNETIISFPGNRIHICIHVHA